MSDEDDARFMRRAIELARTQLGHTGENPAVGCVIVKDGEIIGEGATAHGGRPHAEEIALKAAQARAQDATAYVTLEPCGERSSGAASCALLLADAGVARVVIACEDPSPFASGRGDDILDDAGVEIDEGFLAHEAAPLYADYLARLSDADSSD
jgi:diaminohydroxyphosphoribosylaminopyrimidine deaminase/5-amino-6-(5-phosphoribosylamino)uracil reductase